VQTQTSDQLTIDQLIARNRRRQRRRTPRTLPFGSIVSGTCRAEDIVPALINASDPRWLRMSRADRKRWHALSVEWDALQSADVDDPAVESIGDPYDVLNDLQDLMSAYCPAYAYLGAHPDDGADTGVWCSEYFPDDSFDGLKVDDLSDVPRGYSGEVLVISDHGNMTLYSCSRGRAREIWGIV
jgi:hypothetical protein